MNIMEWPIQSLALNPTEMVSHNLKQAAGRCPAWNATRREEGRKKAVPEGLGLGFWMERGGYVMTATIVVIWHYINQTELKWKSFSLAEFKQFLHTHVKDSLPSSQIINHNYFVDRFGSLFFLNKHII